MKNLPEEEMDTKRQKTHRDFHLEDGEFLHSCTSYIGFDLTVPDYEWIVHILVRSVSACAW